jgi:hypothetical protein
MTAHSTRRFPVGWLNTMTGAERRTANGNNKQNPFASIASMLQPPCSAASQHALRNVLDIAYTPRSSPVPYTTRCYGSFTSARRTARRRYFITNSSLPQALTLDQTLQNCSASPASVEQAATAAQGLQVVCEGTDPSHRVALRCSVAHSTNNSTLASSPCMA